MRIACHGTLTLSDKRRRIDGNRSQPSAEQIEVSRNKNRTVELRGSAEFHRSIPNIKQHHEHVVPP